jgi:hypothetical protein
MSEEEDFKALADGFITEVVRWESVKLDIQAERAADHRWPPLPSSAHPALAAQASFVRSLMAAGRTTILLPRPARLSSFLDYSDTAAMLTPEHQTLTVRRVAAPAPYVGDPYCLVWSVAVDRANRWVAGDLDYQMLREPVPADTP